MSASDSDAGRLASPVDVIPLVPAHLDRVVSLESEIFAGRDPWSRSAFERELAGERNLWLVAVESGALVGYGGGWIVGDEFHLLNLGVAEAFRRRGVATGLLEGLLARAAALGCDAVLLEVRGGNETARRLYEKLGFKMRTVRPGYYSNGEDALLYSLLGLGAKRG